MKETGLRPALAGLLSGVTAFASASKKPNEFENFIKLGIPEHWQHLSTLADQDLLDRGNRLGMGIQPEQQSGEKSVQLLSVFCSVTADHGRKAPDPRYWPITELDVETYRPFPEKPLLSPADVEKQFADLWDKFMDEAKMLAYSFTNAPEEDLGLYLESLLLLLKRYTWCVPSNYSDKFPDVSVYDHARTTAALAAVLPEQNSESAQTQAVLIGGDITGVQAFIYTITARGATSALRGRSFYLQLLTEVVARFVLQELDLPITNLIYAGGGNFFLLARPADNIENIQKKVSQVLLKHHQGDLYLALASVELTQADFFAGRISDCWSTLAGKLQDAKLHRFCELGKELYQSVFMPQGSGGDESKLCKVCGSEHHHFYREQDTPDDEEILKCWPCHSYEILGDQLRHAEYLLLQKGGDLQPDEKDTYQHVFHDLGWRANIYQQLPSPTFNTQRIVLALTSSGRKKLPQQPRTAVGQRSVVNVTPIVQKEDIALYQKKVDDRLYLDAIKPFDLLQEASTGIKRLGILRMDVDNLGDLFANGFGSGATLSRIASLSFAVSMFFEGWVGQLACQVNEESQGSVYAIYSGGDDLFFVGSWDRVVELARRIRSDLTQYAAQHPGIHASAGIALTGGKYPLAQAAEDASRAESQAKSHRWMENGQERSKDSVSFLGQAISWNTFGLEQNGQAGFQSAYSLMTFLSTGKGLRPLLQRLIMLQELYQSAVKMREAEGTNRNQNGQSQVLWGPWNWQSFYILSRLAKQTKNDNIRLLNQKLKDDQFRSIEWIGLAARWAEIYTRGSVSLISTEGENGNG